MAKHIASSHIAAVAVTAGLLVTMIYLVMINVTLAHIETASGLVPFDMRPLGYGPTDAAALLDALGADGRWYYLSRQIPLDTLYPALLALTLIATIYWLSQRRPDRMLTRAAIALSIACALLDYLENLGIAVMISNWPDIPTALVYATSTVTIAKSLATTLAVLLTICIAVVRVRQPKADPRKQAVHPEASTTRAPSPL
ncbi:hypothetical protein [Boseongicola aestuarii]|uniref:Uncharacterized protein n=1 Tax=Boseongicola aestuarii TaxID=1470561 RepID=A0A238IZN2_9RHOB|nr:hypothetical protein [Boseongicola aestuarii]SMX23501.1 hypothetical protein BOA8489_01610 [Boseongicola aestuarii]